MRNVFIHQADIITPLGLSLDENWSNLLIHKSGIQRIEKIGGITNFYASLIQSELINDSIIVDKNSSRIEKMLLLILNKLYQKNVEITPETTVVLSTTKGNIRALAHNPIEAFIPQIANFLQKKLLLQNNVVVVSNACTSGVLAVNIAKRMLQTSQTNQAVILAVDEITEFVLSGFDAFKAMSKKPCKPFDKSRDGITLGEAVGALYMSTKPQNNTWNFQILGEGNINDANHISGPSRTGEGLYKSIKNALEEAKISAENIDYISAHGTATRYNDDMESIVFDRLNMNQTPLNSLKGYFGHTLGASGLIELIFACKQIEEKILLQTHGFEEFGVAKTINVLQNHTRTTGTTFLKTASGFGGSNSAIIVRKYGR